MDFEQIQNLMAAMSRFEFDEVVWREKDSQIHLKRRAFSAHTEHAGEMTYAKEPQAKAPFEQVEPKIEQEEHWIVSPMVGTIYLAPSPDSPSYVKVGDLIQEDSVVCIVEAMKVMNEVRAPLKGIVTEIAVSGGNAVEFGTKLMRISLEKT